MDKDFAIIQGAFLSADRISSLASLLKPDWDKVSPPILDVLAEIGQQKGVKKTLLCSMWLKLLCAEAGEDIEVTWRESAFFALQNGLPELNRITFLELVRSSASVNTFARLLLRQPPSCLCPELQKFVQQVFSSPVREEDVVFFLDVWQELWRIKDMENDSTEEMFVQEVSRLSSSTLQQPAKRLKLDPSESSCSDPDVLMILFHALRDLKGQITSPELCFRALSVSMNALFTSFLVGAEAGISTKEKLEILSQIVTIRERNNEKLNSEMIADSLRDLSSTQVLSKFTPTELKLTEALVIFSEFSKFWFNNGLLKVENKSNPSYAMFMLKLSLRNAIAAFEQTGETLDYAPLKSLFEFLDFPDVDVSPDVSEKITITVISDQMEGFLDFALLFASERRWAACDENYTAFLEKNQSAFRNRDTIIQLVQSIMGKLDSGSVDVSCYRKLMKVTADVFSALDLSEKNKVLAAVMDVSSRGFFGRNTPASVTARFDQELNMAFNCIIQGGGGETSTSSSLSTAVSLVARVAFQNPEAAVKAVCSAAVSNRGAFGVMARILQLLPGLSGRAEQSGAKGLLCKCVQDVMKAKHMSQEEKEQLVKFLSLLMESLEEPEGDGRQRSFLLPQEAITAFVRPNLALGSVDLALSLQLLHSALCLRRQDAAPHWVMLCSPIPLLFVLAQLHNQTLRRESSDCTDIPVLSTETRELLVSVLADLGPLVGAEVRANPDSWSRAVFWLYDKTQELDWTVRFLLKPVWGEHFKHEVPASLLSVCELPEQEWAGLDLPQYGPGTGLLAWMECCCISESLQSTMLLCLSLDQSKAEHVNMFSKGLLVALTQTLPCCSPSQWALLLKALRALIDSGRLHVPFSLEYCDFLPLLDLRSFACELRLSVLLLRVFQLLCGSSCAHWLSRDGWAHVGMLYAHAVRDMIAMLRAKLPLTSDPCRAAEGDGSVPCQEVLFVLGQIYCHAQHVQVMLPGGQCQQLFLCSLELLSHYEAVMGAFPESCSALESDNTRHFFNTITENLQNQEMKTVLQQKIAQLVSSAA